MLAAATALAACGAPPAQEADRTGSGARSVGASPSSGPAVTPTPTPTPAAGAPAATRSGAEPTATRAAAPTRRGPSPSPSAAALAGTAPKPGNWRYVFPVSGRNVSYHPTHSAYPATDIFADCGQPVVAVTDGTVLEVSRVDRYRKDGPQGPLNGGLSVSMLGADGVRYYGSHLTTVTTGIDAGVRVRAGQRLGTVGRTGNANNVCHLHFGISPPCARTGDWAVRRGVVWPAPFLDSWRANGGGSPVAKVTAWQRQHNCAA